MKHLLTMAKSTTSKTDVQDPSSEVIQAIDQMDLKKFSYIQLRRLYATVMQAVDEVHQELKLRAAADNAGDTVKVPVSYAAD